MEILWKDGQKQIAEGKTLSGNAAERIRNIEAKSIRAFF
jgi:hypothetical protein